MRIPEDKFITMILDQADVWKKRAPLRQGQAISLGLNDVDERTAHALDGSKYDCFYKDTLIPAFLKAAVDTYYNHTPKDA